MSVVRAIRKDKYYLLLFTQVLFFGILPFINESNKLSSIIIPVLLGAMMIAGVNAAYKETKMFNVGVAISFVFAVTIILLEFDKYPLVVLAAFLAFMLFFIFVIYGIIKMLLLTSEVKASLLVGAFSGYLMIGVILTFFLIMLNTFDPHTLNIPESTMGFGDFLYFSLITMTTIGYGDISPVNPVAQMVSAFSAIISQFYLAVVVAVIVGKIINAERAKK